MPTEPEGLWMKIYERALDEPRIKRIARRAQLSEFDVFGRMARLWLQSYRSLSEFVDVLDAEIVTGELPGFLDLVVEERLADRVDENTIRVRGAEKALASLRNAANISEANSEKGRKSGIRRRQMSDELRKRTAVQPELELGLNYGLNRTGTAVELQEEIRSSESRSDQNQYSPLLSRSGQGVDEGAPPHSKTQPDANQDGFQPRKPAPPEALALAELLLALVTSNNPAGRLARGNARVRNVTHARFADIIRKLHEVDNLAWSDIESMIRWSQADQFWSRVILGAEKLREKWDSMAAQRMRQPPTSAPRKEQRPGPTELAMREAEELRAARSGR